MFIVVGLTVNTERNAFNLSRRLTDLLNCGLDVVQSDDMSSLAAAERHNSLKVRHSTEDD